VLPVLLRGPVCFPASALSGRAGQSKAFLRRTWGLRELEYGLPYATAISIAITRRGSLLGLYAVEEKTLAQMAAGKRRRGIFSTFNP
jgi:hypothetical protein